MIVVVDCDVPWINTQCHPKKDAKIYHIDVDPLKQQMPVFYLDALARYRADSYTAVNQLHTYINSSEELSQKISSSTFEERWSKLSEAHKQKLDVIASLAKPGDDGHYNTSYLMHKLRQAVPKDTIFAVEAVTNTGFVADQIQATIPGSWINCGGGGLGWSGGGKAVCQGDGVLGGLTCCRGAWNQARIGEGRR